MEFLKRFVAHLKRRCHRLIRLHIAYQCLFATLFIWVVLLLLAESLGHTLAWAVGAGSLASTTFIVFLKPSDPSASMKQLLGSYIICAIVGMAGRFLMFCFAHLFNIYNANIFGTIAAISVGISLFLMALLRLKHPPAVGLALVAVLQIAGFSAIFIILISVLVLSIIHHIFGRYMHHLV